VAAHSRAMRNKKGEIIYYESIVEDITEQLRHEEESKKQAEQLIRSNQELEQFAYILSHDLKEPLRMVSIYTELIQNELKEQATPKVSEYIQFTLEGSNRMQKMIGDLLHYSKIKGELNPLVEIDCNIVLNTVLEDLKSAIKNLGLLLSTIHYQRCMGTLPKCASSFRMFFLMPLNLEEQNL
jgi:light-regulated signal transduction histidine kinase (bacteriophytochrome)